MLYCKSAHLSSAFQQSVLLMTFRMTYESNYSYKNMNLQMSYELHRLYTFNNSLWKLLPGKHSPSVLAHIGFFYSGVQAIIVCYKCLCNIDCSQLNDSASDQHKQLSPHCLVVIGKATDNVLLVNPDEVMKTFAADTSLLDTTDRQTVAVGLDSQSQTVELSLFKTAYTVLLQAYARCQKRGVFANVDSEVFTIDIIPVDRSNPDFDRLR